MQRNLTATWSVFGNAGYVSKVPIFDGVIDDTRGIVNPQPENEKFFSLEVTTHPPPAAGTQSAACPARAMWIAWKGL